MRGQRLSKKSARLPRRIDRAIDVEPSPKPLKRERLEKQAAKMLSKPYHQNSAKRRAASIKGWLKRKSIPSETRAQGRSGKPSGEADTTGRSDTSKGAA